MLKLVVDAGVPALVFLAMVVVGMDLTPDDFRRVARQPGTVVAATVGQFVLLPAIGWLLVRCLGLQLVATMFAIRAGWRDARARRRLFFWTLVRDPKERQPLLGELWRDVGKLFLAAVVLDVVYQIIVLRWVYPVPSLIVATTLAIVPYLVVRGLTNRIVSRMPLRPPPDNKGVPVNVSGDGGENGPGA